MAALCKGSAHRLATGSMAEDLLTTMAADPEPKLRRATAPKNPNAPLHVSATSRRTLLLADLAAGADD